MVASYRIYTSEHLKYVRISGKTDFDELHKLFNRYVRDPEFRPDLRILADLTDMADAVTGLWEISKLKKLYQYAYQDAVGAVDVVIVTSTGTAYRTARAFQMLMWDRKPLNIQISNSIADAMSKLGLTHDRNFGRDFGHETKAGETKVIPLEPYLNLPK